MKYYISAKNNVGIKFSAPCLQQSACEKFMTSESFETFCALDMSYDFEMKN
jgi:hypothetical protein